MQSTFFKNPFSRRALDSPLFTRPAANVVKSPMVEIAKEWRIHAKAELLPPPKLSNRWQQPPSLPPSSDDIERNRYRMTHCKTEMTKANYLNKRTDTTVSLLVRRFRSRHKFSLFWTPVTSYRIARATICRLRTHTVSCFSGKTGLTSSTNSEKTLYMCRRVPNLPIGPLLNAF